MVLGQNQGTKNGANYKKFKRWFECKKAFNCDYLIMGLKYRH